MGRLSSTGVAIWRFKARKRNSMQSAPSLAGKVTVEKQYHSEKRIDFSDLSVYTEKPQKAALSPRSFDGQTGWVPQVEAYAPPDAYVPMPEPTASPKSKSKPRTPQLSVKTPAENPLDVARSPPPSYFASDVTTDNNMSPRLIPIPPSPGIHTTQPPTPPTPPVNKKAKTSFSALSEQPPMPSPRSESFAPQDLAMPSGRESYDTSASDESSQKLPRLMSVAATFTPSLEDELAIKLGDTVRMVDEYRDGWCLVQRVGRIDAPKGVVPRFCLQERRGVVPMVPTRKYSNGSLKSQGWR